MTGTPADAALPAGTDIDTPVPQVMRKLIVEHIRAAFDDDTLRPPATTSFSRAVGESVTDTIEWIAAAFLPDAAARHAFTVLFTEWEGTLGELIDAAKRL